MGNYPSHVTVRERKLKDIVRKWFDFQIKIEHRALLCKNRPLNRVRIKSIMCWPENFASSEVAFSIIQY